MGKIMREITTNVQEIVEKEELKAEKIEEALGEELKGTKIFMVKGEKKIDTPESGFELGDIFKNKLEGIEDIYNTNKSWKRIYNIAYEVTQNTAGYSTANKPIIFEIKESNENNIPVCKIETLNYFEDPDGSKTEKLIKKLDDINNSSAEEKKRKYKEALDTDEKVHIKGGAGLGFLCIADKLKNDIDKPYIYSFQKDKNGLVRFKLLINIPLKESLIPLKKEYEKKQLQKQIENEGMFQMKLEEEIRTNNKGERENSTLRQQLEGSKQRMVRLQNSLNK